MNSLKYIVLFLFHMIIFFMNCYLLKLIRFDPDISMLGVITIGVVTLFNLIAALIYVGKAVISRNDPTVPYTNRNHPSTSVDIDFGD